MYHYPSLFIFVGKTLQKEFPGDYWFEHYETACWGLENSIINYSLCVHGCFLPWLNQEKIDGKIKPGKHTI